MTTLVEGRLTFTFPAGAQVCKYDELSFYRNQFIKMADGIKAIDLAYVEGNTLWLIEVKDYRHNPRIKTISLVDEMAGKLRNSLAGLWAAKCNATVQAEKQFANNALKTKKICVVLHLEEPEQAGRLAPTKQLKASTLQKMKQKLKSVDAHACIVDQFCLKPRMNWQVTG